MPSKEQIKETIERLRSQLVPSESEVQNLYQKAVDIDYWKSFLPRMGVLDLKSLDHLESAAFSSEQEAWALAHLARHGYFQLPPLASTDVTARMCTSVEVLRNAGTPDLMLADYRLAEGTGVDAVEAVRAAYGPVPAWIVSGEADIAERGIRLPVLQKPITPERLLAALRAAFP